MSKRTRRSELPMLGVLFIAGGFFASAAVAVPPAINIVSGNGNQGGVGTFSVTLTANGAQVAATLNDIAFDPLTPVAVRTAGTSGNCAVTTTTACSTDADCPDLAPPFTGKEPCVNESGPACTVDSTIGKGGFFTFLPNGCTPTTAGSCTGIRAMIVAVDNLDAIPDGSTLYTCNVDVSSSTTVGNDYALTISNESAGDTSQALISGVTGANGTVHVLPPVTGFLVCDVAPSTGDNQGEFGNGSVLNSDVVAVFKASLTTPPTAGSARFSAMDAAPADVVPSCGGSNSILNSDVVLCFRRSLSTTEPNYRRTIDGSCTSALAQ